MNGLDDSYLIGGFSNSNDAAPWRDRQAEDQAVQDNALYQAMVQARTKAQKLNQRLGLQNQLAQYNQFNQQAPQLWTQAGAGFGDGDPNALARWNAMQNQFSRQAAMDAAANRVNLRGGGFQSMTSANELADLSRYAPLRAEARANRAQALKESQDSWKQSVAQQQADAALQNAERDNTRAAANRVTQEGIAKRKQQGDITGQIMAGAINRPDQLLSGFPDLSPAEMARYVNLMQFAKQQRGQGEYDQGAQTEAQAGNINAQLSANAMEPFSRQVQAEYAKATQPNVTGRFVDTYRDSNLNNPDAPLLWGEAARQAANAQATRERDAQLEWGRANPGGLQDVVQANPLAQKRFLGIQSAAGKIPGIQYNEMTGQYEPIKRYGGNEVFEAAPPGTVDDPELGGYWDTPPEAPVQTGGRRAARIPAPGTPQSMWPIVKHNDGNTYQVDPNGDLQLWMPAQPRQYMGAFGRYTDGTSPSDYTSQYE